jgi:hypothetical protein
MTARSGIGDAPQRQEDVRGVTGRSCSHRIFHHSRYSYLYTPSSPTMVLSQIFI